MALVDKSAIVLTSPKPTTEPFNDASKALIASLPFKPAEVIKNKASAADLAETPYLLAITFALSPIRSTSSTEIPTKSEILDNSDSKSAKDFDTTTENAVKGAVKPTDKVVPNSFNFFPIFCRSLLAFCICVENCFKSAKNLILIVAFPDTYYNILLISSKLLIIRTRDGSSQGNSNTSLGEKSSFGL